MVESLCTFPLSKLLLTCSGEWERRLLKFGIKDGYSAAALATYIATHKLNALSSVSTEKVNGYWDNAAHASVTGCWSFVDLQNQQSRYSTQHYQLGIADLNSLASDEQADVIEVLVQHSGHFTVKTGFMREYEFQAEAPNRAQRWKKEIEQRVGQSKLRRSEILKHGKYKELYAHLTGTSSYSRFSKYDA